MKRVKIVRARIKTSFSKAKARKIIKEMIALGPLTKPTKEEVEAGRKRIRAFLIRTGYSVKEATRMTNRKNYF